MKLIEKLSLKKGRLWQRINGVMTSNSFSRASPYQLDLATYGGTFPWWQFGYSDVSSPLRFPFTALQYGGGTFVIPYTIIVILVGKPLYYMELLLGQFSSRGCIKVYNISPAVRGVGIGQCFCTIIVLSIYTSVMALTIRYFLASFDDPLPWSLCKEVWNTSCVDSKLKGGNFSNERPKSSAEIFFV